MSARRVCDVGDTERECTKCHVSKPLAEFGSAGKNPYSLTHSHCLACLAVAARERYARKEKSIGPRAGIGGQPRKYA